MPQIVQSGVELELGWTPQTDVFPDAFEHQLGGLPQDALAPAIDEGGLILGGLGLGLIPAIAQQPSVQVVPDRHQAGFVELGFPNGEPLLL